MTIEELLEVYENTTPGEWLWFQYADGSCRCVADGRVVAKHDTANPGDPIQMANARWIANCHNEFPAILKRIQELEEEVTRMNIIFEGAK